MITLYFDPGLGALIVQAIIAAVAGVVLFTKNLKYKVMAFFGKNIEPQDDIDINDEDELNDE